MFGTSRTGVFSACSLSIDSRKHLFLFHKIRQPVDGQGQARFCVMFVLISKQARATQLRGHALRLPPSFSAMICILTELAVLSKIGDRAEAPLRSGKSRAARSLFAGLLARNAWFRRLPCPWAFAFLDTQDRRNLPLDDLNGVPLLGHQVMARVDCRHRFVSVV